ncbi:MAG: diguanylate cyclase [Ferrovum myxofaciens]
MHAIINRELRVLMLEDTATDAELIVRELRRAGIAFTSIRVTTRDAFTRALEEFHPDIILSDYNLPDFNGLVALEIVQRTHPEVPVIMVTGALTDVEAVELIHAGAKDYVLKDRLARLAPAVRLTLLAEQEVHARKVVDQELRIAATAFETQEGIVITDRDQHILRVNCAFTRLTGYSAMEALGRTPAILKSGRQDAAFYQAMWETLNRDKYWQGELWNRRKNGEIYPEWLTITAVLDGDGRVTNYVGVFSDITLRKEADEKIHQLAFYDPLTGLPNRRLLHDRLQQAMTSSVRSQCKGALLFLDLDNFKVLNDTRGHDIGDLLLIEVAKCLRDCVRSGDTVARIGGDEFIIMLENLSEDTQQAAAAAQDVGEKVLKAINHSFSLQGVDYHCSSSIGINLFHGNDTGMDDLLRHADTAMYQAKASGRNTLRFFDPAMQIELEERTALMEDLRQALPLQQLRLYHQIQVNERGVVGSEVLLRWQHPVRGLISPMEFIPLAEETGLIVPIGAWVLHMACVQLKAWQVDPLTRHLRIAVNVSARQFSQPNFVEQVLEVLKDTGVNPLKLGP